MIFSVAEESSYRLVQRSPPGLLAAENTGLDLKVAAVCSLGGGTVTWVPGDRDSARCPWMVKAALGRPGNVSHLDSRTYFRTPSYSGGGETATDLLGVNEPPRGRLRSFAQVSERSRSSKVDVVRCSCCTLLLHQLTLKRQA
jgi:hypothetical protein